QRQFLRERALENLISRELVAQGAADEGIMVADEEVRDLIVKDIPIFQDNGRFERSRYQAFLENMRMSAGDFEEKLRKDVQNNRARRLFEMTSAPLNQEVGQALELRNTEINVSYAVLDRDGLLKAA